MMVVGKRMRFIKEFMESDRQGMVITNVSKQSLDSSIKALYGEIHKAPVAAVEKDGQVFLVKKSFA